MKLVRIVKNWNWPDLLRQTPKSGGIWNNIKFTEEKVNECDYLIVLNYSSYEVKANCPKHNIWLIQQEPPYNIFRNFSSIPDVYKKVFTTDPDCNGRLYEHSQPALPWHIDKSYDQLKKEKYPLKKYKLSWITSFKKIVSGHKKRMEFLDRLRDNIQFDLVATEQYYRNEPDYPDIAKLKKDLFKKGYTKIVKSKWEGLAPYRYSLIVENYSGPYYWSEKMADCFLGFTMPIYYGCTDISNFFPKGSFVQIDINAANVSEKIKAVINSDLWDKQKKAVIKARQMVLDKYQFFPYIAGKIMEWEKKGKFSSEKELITIEKVNNFKNLLISRLKSFVRI